MYLRAPTVEVAAGYYHNVAVVPDGVRAWGRNNHGQVGDGTTTNRNSAVLVKNLPDPGQSGFDVAAGGYHSMAKLRSTGQLLTWGANDFGQLGDGSHDQHTEPVQIEGPLSKDLAIGAGEDHTLRGYY